MTTRFLPGAAATIAACAIVIGAPAAASALPDAGTGATGYLIVSSQGDDTFAVYQRQGRNKLVGAFGVGGVAGADEINGSDGLAVTNRPAGEYREGLLVTHDEPETGAGVDEERDATNFSYVQWADVADALGLKVSTVAGNDPRFG
ncbi:phytase [Agromyces sp. GXS1127]|uniref:phytase n=1 Tax=Agromyces sp. GXS1127 TaxID=3424181 RepID=UPI003D31683C